MRKTSGIPLDKSLLRGKSDLSEENCQEHLNFSSGNETRKSRLHPE
ncbi:MAG: hypothetical protein NTU54_06905 [Candidatus Omnitrophica bacterium]|nr:hypothetical protein [Candidatus Omnitrophota bacterium]